MDTGNKKDSEIAEFIGSGLELMAQVERYREDNKKRSLNLISANRRDAHLVLQSTLHNMRHEYSGKMIADPTEDNLYQMALLNSLVVLIDPTYEMLLSGLYIGAGALIRQSIEMNARVMEIQKQAHWTSGKTPNVGQLPLGASRFYGEMSAVAHFSRAELGRITEVEPTPGVRAQSLSPVVKKDTLLRLLDFQLLSMALTVGFQMEFFRVAYDCDLEQYDKMGLTAMAMLDDEGLLERK
jgi:hypothetical protein